MLDNEGDIVDEISEALEESAIWPHSVIHEGMLVQPSPGHREFHLRLDQSGLVTKQTGEIFEVLWNDDSLERLTSYSLEPLHDRDLFHKFLRDHGYGLVEAQLRGDWGALDKNSGDTHDPSASASPVCRFGPGDLVSPGYGLDAFHDYQGAGLVIEVDDTVVPARIYVSWGNSDGWINEDELLPYDD